MSFLDNLTEKLNENKYSSLQSKCSKFNDVEILRTAYKSTQTKIIDTYLFL